MLRANMVTHCFNLHSKTFCLPIRRPAIVQLFYELVAITLWALSLVIVVDRRS